MQRRYVIAHTESSSGWGGQEIRIVNEMLAMRERGHQLFLSARAASAIHQRACSAGFSVVPLRDNKLGFPKMIWQLSRFFRSNKVQVVNTHSSRDGWISGIAARLARVPLIIRSRHVDVDYRNRLLSRVAFARLPHHVVTTSQRIAAGLIRDLNLSTDCVTSISTGVDIAKFNPSITGTLHSELKLPAARSLVGMVSVLRSWKGHVYFLEAARELVRRGTNAYFVIAGEGDGRAGIERLRREYGLEQHLTLLGHREDVPQILASLSILVLPSIAHEGVPQIILQAQAMGKAVIGTAVGGIPEVVEDRVTGVLVPPKDGRTLADGIELLLKDAPLRRRLGETSSARVLRENTLARMCEQIEAVYAKHLPSRCESSPS